MKTLTTSKVANINPDVIFCINGEGKVFIYEAYITAKQGLKLLVEHGFNKKYSKSIAEE
jgi:hypothetical protein